MLEQELAVYISTGMNLRSMSAQPRVRSIDLPVITWIHPE